MFKLNESKAEQSKAKQNKTKEKTFFNSIFMLYKCCYAYRMHVLETEMVYSVGVDNDSDQQENVIIVKDFSFRI